MNEQYRNKPYITRTIQAKLVVLLSHQDVAMQKSGASLTSYLLEYELSCLGIKNSESTEVAWLRAIEDWHLGNNFVSNDTNLIEDHSLSSRMT